MKFPSLRSRPGLRFLLLLAFPLFLVACDDDEDDPAGSAASFESIFSTDFEEASLDPALWSLPEDSSRFGLGTPAASGSQSLRLQMRNDADETNDSVLFSAFRFVVLDQAYDELRLRAMTRCSGGGVAQLVLAQTLPNDEFLMDALWRRRCTPGFTEVEFTWREAFAAGDTVAIILDGELTTGTSGDVWFDDLELAGR